MIMPRILFIQPTQYGADGTTLCKQKVIHLPGLAFALLAAYLPPHWEAELLLEVVDDIDFDREADIVAIGAMGHALFRGFEIAAEFRRRGRTVVMGGYMVSIVAAESLSPASLVRRINASANSRPPIRTIKPTRTTVNRVRLRIGLSG